MEHTQAKGVNAPRMESVYGLECSSVTLLSQPDRFAERRTIERMWFQFSRAVIERRGSASLEQTLCLPLQLSGQANSVTPRCDAHATEIDCCLHRICLF
jgi:hypothetical protein